MNTQTTPEAVKHTPAFEIREQENDFLVVKTAYKPESHAAVFLFDYETKIPNCIGRQEAKEHAELFVAAPTMKAQIEVLKAALQTLLDEDAKVVAAKSPHSAQSIKAALKAINSLSPTQDK